MIDKVKFKCQSCDATATLSGNGAPWHGVIRALQDAGWHVVGDRASVRHYCPTCPIEHEWDDKAKPPEKPVEKITENAPQTQA